MANGRDRARKSKLVGPEAKGQDMVEMVRSLLSGSPEEQAEEAKDRRAAEIAGNYLRQAAISWACEQLAPIFRNDDIRIAQVETLLRAARHMRRRERIDGDPMPSVRLPDGSVTPLTERLLQLMGRDQVLKADNADDCKSFSKASKGTQQGRDARAKIEELAASVIREGEIIS